MFRPCIDLREGRVVQMVGGTLRDDPAAVGDERVHFVSEQPSTHYAHMYRTDRLRGGHVIMLGPGCEAAAAAALAAYPGGLQVGGGINAANAQAWLDAGAIGVIVTSWLFDGPNFVPDRLAEIVDVIGAEQLVVDLSCRWRDGAYWVVTDRWQTFTSLRVDEDTLQMFAESCGELLVHGVDVEGTSAGVDLQLVQLLGENTYVPVTYAGGARSLDDLQTVHDVSSGQVDLTIGSALDIFGGTGVRYADCVAFNRTHRSNW
ncbi:MAG: phosphoribosylformimino-5-aminoimidazole carboxamide ribotide isomerase [Ilumatobacteraceae bacterium]|nr:phosphoribosylformimino-5-aminoimidazole carboxamide ribotide isomerase [Ilumatobacteraceae bacterium]